ncbi:MAG TPA: hypothetical protein GXZ68_04970 [Firmicutes bacterium]|nr:hypothetical protein [Bacillota bacterium]
MDANRNAFMILLSLVSFLFAFGGEDRVQANSYEVYIAHVDTWGWTGIRGQIPYWFVLFDDGEIYYDLPLEGLHGLDRDRLKTEDREVWGTYQTEGRTGIFTREGYPNEPIEIDAQGQIVFRGDRYRRLAPVDFKRLEGAWTYHIVRSDAFNLELYPDYKPIIVFHRDGTFVDLGLFKGDYLLLPEDYGTPGREASMQPGQGWYAIRDFTLILHYGDGRVRRAGFCFYYGEELQEQPVALYIYRSRLYLMD